MSVDSYAVSMKRNAHPHPHPTPHPIPHSLPLELRTPLNGIIGNTELLLSDLDLFDPPEIREILEDVYTAGRRLHRLIVNFLLYADLEIIGLNADRVQFLRNAQAKDVKAAIAEAATRQAKLSEREADLNLALEDATVQIAANQLEKVVEEFIDNACKFSDPGTPIEIRSEISDGWFVLRVGDRGRGMTPEQIDGIGAHMQFERKLYEQQGSGLGLSIAKRIVELHGGELVIESQPDQGSTVSVKLPLAISEDSQSD